jgi:phenylalanine-4-hydroxylase
MAMETHSTLNNKMSSSVKDYEDKERSVSIILTVKEAFRSLTDTLEVFQRHNVNLLHIESRASSAHGNHDFLIRADNTKGELSDAIAELEKKDMEVRILSHSQADTTKEEVPWFPRKMKDFDKFPKQILGNSIDIDPNHPDFADPVHHIRRKQFTDIAFNYKHGDQIPRMEYTEAEKAVWRELYDNLTTSCETYGCEEFNNMLPLLETNCGYSRDNIPQLQDISDFLRDCTGFTLRPVAGYLAPRDFLAGLALRVFHSTQYVRHPSRILFNVEPDVFHELLGHVPLLCNPDYAQFSQEIGLASLGASDEYVDKLAKCYLFTVEFGICRQGDSLKAFGAALLTSMGELQYSLSGKPEIRPFVPEKLALQKFEISEFQPTYFVAESFSDARKKIVEYARTIPRPFAIRYNPYNRSIEVIDSKEQTLELIKELRFSVDVIEEALSKL